MKKISSILVFVFLQIAISSAQRSYKNGDVIRDLSFKKILNSNSQNSSLKEIKNNITIIDFFGTWCHPCIKALPILGEISKKYKNDIEIILISNEKEAQLAKFIKGRSDFIFPVVVDEGDAITNLFQPPALPYTVVINKENKIIAITEAALITDEQIKKWLSEKISSDKKAEPANIVESNPTVSNKPAVMNDKKNSNEIIQLSQDFIYAAKIQNETAALIEQLKNLDYQQLLTKLPDDNTKKAFWINLYNGYTQVLLQQHPEKYKNRGAFFKAKQIEVAQKEFSLDEIEHGILRHSKIKLSLGYLNKLFPSKREKQLRVKKLDYRLHFSLNCGAKSCPPIAFYNPGTLDTQLDVATKAYLSGEAEYDSANNVIHLPALMGWFRGDFGGKKGMLKILKKNNIIPTDASPKIKFKKYDWTLALNNYK